MPSLAAFFWPYGARAVQSECDGPLPHVSLEVTRSARNSCRLRMRTRPGVLVGAEPPAPSARRLADEARHRPKTPGSA